MLKRYYSEDQRKTMLELNDNHTLWKIVNENLTMDDYSFMLNAVINQFENITKTELFLCGRSGRHVCIEDNKRNQLNYWKYKTIAEKLEHQLIDDCNNLKSEKINAFYLS